MKWINYGYSMKHRAKYGRKGRLWQSRYQSRLIDSEKYLLTCMGYVELSAVKHKLVEVPKKYRWSSYHRYAFGKDDSIVDINPDYINLAGTEEERQRFYRELGKMWLVAEKARVPNWGIE